MLEEICAKNGWGAPSYELFEVVGGGDNKLYVYKVLLSYMLTAAD